MSLPLACCCCEQERRKDGSVAEKKKLTARERLAQEREARYQVIQRASAGDEEARKELAGGPERLRVYTPEEREAFIKEHGLSG